LPAIGSALADRRVVGRRSSHIPPRQGGRASCPSVADLPATAI